ncbi:AAA family ATPase [Campylobacter mucosalis]|uniref:AAA family ATPase n=1 Tax=Campylobacter mucosalis TaxID=202 RepID=UPI00146FF92E|nr:AAA family ATPase [Campylobacter mucosalis]
MQKFNKKNIIFIVGGLLVCLLVFAWIKSEPEDISYARYEVLLSQNAIQKASIDDGYVYLYTTQGRYRILMYAIDIGVLSRSVPTTKNSSFNGVEYAVLFSFMVVVFFILVILVARILVKNLKAQTKDNKTQAAAFEIEGMLSSSIIPAISNVKFSDVAGIDEVKVELNEIVDFLKNPSKYREFGIKMPKGVLMVGPPGVGKTLVAKAVAGEANVPFFYQNGASFVQIYVGVGAKRVRELFSRAKAMAPSIVFIDEIDAVGKSRGDGRNDEREATLNQLLTEMDGFLDNSGVIVIAATNRIEMIDDALLRAGRFDRRIFLSLPDLKDREAILKTYLKNKVTNVNIEDIAKMSVGFSGAALNTLVNEAAISALRRKSGVIELMDFESVQSKVVFGQRKALSYSQKDKKIQADYQAAKAISAYWFDIKFDKISLTQDRFVAPEFEIVSKSSMFSKLKVLLSGIVRLELVYADTFSNSADDLRDAKELATKMVYEFGMSQSLLPNQNDVENLLKQAKDEIREFMSGMSIQSELVADHLLKFEVIQREQIAEILNKTYE